MDIMTRIADEKDRRSDEEALCALVIDDETELSEEISEALEDSGIRAISTNSFSKALSILESDASINIVLSDYFLEEHRATGMQLIDCCRTMFPDRYFRFGLMSGDRFVLMEHWQDTEVLKLHKPLTPAILPAQTKPHPASSGQFKPRAWRGGGPPPSFFLPLRKTPTWTRMPTPAPPPVPPRPAAC